MSDDATQANVRLTDGLGPLGVGHWTAAGEPYFGAARRDGEQNQYGPWYSKEQVAAMVAAERERCARVCEQPVEVLRLPDEPRYDGDDRPIVKHTALGLAEAIRRGPNVRAEPTRRLQDGCK